jgi:hypothetical protein
MVHPSLRLFISKGLLAMLVMRGFLKMGYLKTSVRVVGSVFTRPALTFFQVPIMLLRKE